MLTALRAVEVAETGYAVFEFDTVTGSAAAFASKNEPGDGRWSYLADPARYEGGFYSSPHIDDGSTPRKLCGTALTLDVGRGLVGLVTHVHLPLPPADFPTPEIACHQDGIEMQVGESPIAHWEHWYSDWEPVCPREVHDLVGYKTTVKRDFVEALCERNSLNTAVWCRVKSGTRQYSYTEFEDHEVGFWIDL
jgi:hypothetical protein